MLAPIRSGSHTFIGRTVARPADVDTRVNQPHGPHAMRWPGCERGARAFASRRLHEAGTRQRTFAASRPPLWRRVGAAEAHTDCPTSHFDPLVSLVVSKSVRPIRKSQYKNQQRRVGHPAQCAPARGGGERTLAREVPMATITAAWPTPMARPRASAVTGRVAPKPLNLSISTKSAGGCAWAAPYCTNAFENYTVSRAARRALSPQHR